jgi:hypothetical protein
MGDNKVKDAQLGMFYGTAAARLKKMVMFNLLQRLGEDDCFKCHKKIETPEELSLEHKENWLHNDTALFWDLNNISFSHLKCNRPERRPGGVGLRKVGPDGTSWCAGHKQFLATDKFRRHCKAWNGFYYYCCECEALKRRAYKGRRKA